MKTIFDGMIKYEALNGKTNLEILDILKECCFEASTMSNEELTDIIRNITCGVSVDGTLTF